ncbi:MAG: glycoside hydrolase family 2 TIM barrel-domain containing protein, partial [Phycisphaeraceae bacterium]|nr:glycoside hydrolase family 2 TIM barrel-domain containing protein [Phycisphaeraceae bacterium]
GSMDEAGKGDRVAEEPSPDLLARVWRWIGPAWYQREVTIPESWAGKRITLFLERTKDSQVWVDDRWAGSDDSLSTAHVFDLAEHLTPGKHTITVLIDNAKLPPVGPCHQVDERTQTNWNGILGEIYLSATDPVWIDGLDVYPDPEAGRMAVRVALGNATGRGGAVSLTASAEVMGRKLNMPGRRVEVDLADKGAVATFDLEIPDEVPTWDEFDPTLIQLTVSSLARLKGQERKKLRDGRSVTFGYRSFKTARGQFVVNGRSTYLRGKNDCALFPLTGYAPMDKAYWLKHLGIAADYGINHFRFHSWCPPEAAFAAADELGIYFQVELPNKRGITEPDHHDYSPPKEAYETLDELRGDGGDPAERTAYLRREGERMLAAFGNHPSFVMMTLGNEIGGDENVMASMCDHFRDLDDRHLYAMGTNHFHWDIRYREADEFWVIKGTEPGKHIRGASWDARGHIQYRPPSTTMNYDHLMRGIPIPVVGHEMAQYEVYPDYDEIDKYTGVLKAKNFEIFRDRLKAAGMFDQAKDFHRASGAISLICHREDVEASLRTRAMGGFQMLDLQDFSGQGTALIGMLDVFMDSKGLVTPEQWRQFCCETVPLLLMERYTWTNDQLFTADVEVAHYGPVDLEAPTVQWRVTDGSRQLGAGDLQPDRLATGMVTSAGAIAAPLNSVKKPKKLRVELAIADTDYANQYDLWVYPSKIKTEPPKNVTVTRAFSRKARRALAAGERVLVLADPAKIGNSVINTFHSGFWSPMFRTPDREHPLGRDTEGTQGILCDPDHPIFRNFPTEYHTNWQWWQLVNNARSVILDDTPDDYRPIVQMIDGVDRNHKLGMIFEARVGEGRLLVCSIDLPQLQEHPEARQLLASIQRYAGSRDFSPEHQLPVGQVADLLS